MPGVGLRWEKPQDEGPAQRAGRGLGEPRPLCSCGSSIGCSGWCVAMPGSASVATTLPRWLLGIGTTGYGGAWCARSHTVCSGFVPPALHLGPHDSCQTLCSPGCHVLIHGHAPIAWGPAPPQPPRATPHHQLSSWSHYLLIITPKGTGWLSPTPRAGRLLAHR